MKLWTEWSWHSQGRQRWSDQALWIPPRASQALLIWLWPTKPALSLLTLPLDVTDSQKLEESHSHAQDAQEHPAFCWFCRKEGQSQPETCTDHSEQRGRVQHLLSSSRNQTSAYSICFFPENQDLHSVTPQNEVTAPFWNTDSYYLFSQQQDRKTVTVNPTLENLPQRKGV